MARHDLPSEIKTQEIGKAQDRYLSIRNRMKSDQSFKGKGILEPERKSSPESLTLYLCCGQYTKCPNKEYTTLYRCCSILKPGI